MRLLEAINTMQKTLNLLDHKLALRMVELKGSPALTNVLEYNRLLGIRLGQQETLNMLINIEDVMSEKINEHNKLKNKKGK